MKKFLFSFGAIAMGAMFALSLAACGETNENTTGSDDPDTQKTPPVATETLTSAKLVSAIQESVEAKEQNYDFTLDFSGSLSLGSLQTPDATAKYVCNYRFNTETGALSFKRVTSGALLYDATEYIYSSGDSRVVVKMNDKNEVKKTSVEPANADLKLVNLPFTELVSSLSTEEIESITKLPSGEYRASLRLSSEKPALKALCGALGKMDTSINLKGVTFDNPVNGLDFTFRMSGEAFTGYTVKARIDIPVKGASANLDLAYTQNASSTPVAIPSTTGIVTDQTEIGREIDAIDAALTAVRSSSAYSLDVEAVNEMDPAWNVIATKDSYKARLYKNTAEGGDVSFNHSFEFHSHHEEQGRETYKFTIGNTQENKTYLLSRKGTNTLTELSNVTAETQFDLLTAPFGCDAADFDCLKKVTEKGKTTYTFFLKDAVVAAMSEEIVAFLNTNESEGVVDVENNFNHDDYTVKDAALTVVMEGDTLVSMKLDTEIKYNPTAGEYTENNVTLNNTLSLTVNENLSKAQDYSAPKKPEATLGIGGLKYIL